MRRAAVVLAAAAIVLGLSGCTATETPKPPSSACDAAFSTASTAINDHYNTHPMFGAEYDALYEDGQISDEEQSTLSAMIADEEAKFAAIVDPVYDACDGVEDLYSGGYAHKDDADWALLENEHMSREENKKIFVVSHCYGNTARPACSDFVEDEWR